MKTRCVILSVLLFSSLAEARPILRLKRAVEEEVGRLSEALQAREEAPPSSEGPAWQVRNLYLRLWANIGFKLPPVLSLNLIPQIEMTWHRKEEP